MSSLPSPTAPTTSAWRAFADAVHRHQELIWLVAFGLCQVLRAGQIFVLAGPMDHVFSDPQRHLDNARHFLKPGPMGCSNPYFYQLFLWVVLQITHEKKQLINIMAATLCVAYPYFWYRFARLVMKARVNALRFGVFISLIPTQAVIFQYFMNETSILPLMGASLWATASSVRQRSAWRFLLATVLWTCTILSRSIAAPMAIVAMTYALFHQRNRVLRPLFWRPLVASVAGLVAGTGIWIAAQHSRPILEYATPFGDNPSVGLYFVSGQKIYETSYTKPGHWTYTYGFSSPSLYISPFYPFKFYESVRKGTFKWTTNVETHGDDMKELWWKTLRKNIGMMPRLVFENVVVIAFGHTWPESGLDNLQGLICVWERWIWFPMTVVAFFGCLRFMRRRRSFQFVPAFVVFSICTLYGLQLAVMEGRYRKPVEPIIVIGVAWLLDARRKRAPWALAAR